MKRRAKYLIYVILIVIISWLIYFNVVSYVNFKATNLKYHKTLKEYKKLNDEFTNLEEELKELQKQIENSGNNISQTRSSTSTPGFGSGK